MKLNFSQQPTGLQWSDWQWQLQHSCHSVKDIATLLNLPPEHFGDLQEVEKRYSVFVTPYYLSLAAKADAADPILQQCLPHPAELIQQPGDAPDALDELRCSPVERLVHRYPDRALFVTGNRCAIHCRHCMRKRDWCHAMAPVDESLLQRACDYLRHTPQVREVLISGGDPLMLPEEELQLIIDAFSSVPSIEMLRIGTRVPVVLPQRITPRLAAILASGKTTWVATHFNHPLELTPAAASAAEILVRNGISLVNQSVLLKGINDDADTLGRLFTGLLKIRIKPYYLFHGDPIAGTTHFRTGVQKGLDIMNQLRGRISGMALPAFAFDLPHGAGKIRLQPEHSLGVDSATGAQIYPSYQGEAIPYPDR